MAAAATFTLANFPYGIDNTLNNFHDYGTIAITGGTYLSTGVPLSFTPNTPCGNPKPFFGIFGSQTSGYQYRYDPVNSSVRIYETSQFPGGFPPGVIAANFAASANWGTSPTLAPSASSNQGSFALTITAQASTGANPTITLTFPVPFDQPPVFVCNRGDALSDAGYFVFTSSTTAVAVFTFVGSPTATHVYVLEAYGVAPNLLVPALTTAAITPGAGFGTSPTLALSGTSVQGAFLLTITAQATTAANPTITITFPTPYAAAPQFVVSRADTLADAGYWVVTSSSTTTAVFTFVGTPTATHVYKMAAVANTPSAPAVTTAAFAASANFGTTPTLALNVGATQAAFALTVTAGASTGANPTITLTFPTVLGVAPNFVCSRGDALSDAGYWVVTSTSTTTAVFTFIGTPTAAHVYVLDAFAQSYASGAGQLSLGSTIPPAVVADVISAQLITTRV